jgi:hypothetical protein
MNVIEIERALNSVAYSRKKWYDAKREFDKDADHIMHRLLLEAAAQKMSVQQVARCLKATPKQVRALMRRFGMNPKSSRTLLAKDAAEALHANAGLMGINVKNFDLMSPLAYLPMGAKMRTELAQSQGQVTEVSGNAEEAWESFAKERDYYYPEDYDYSEQKRFWIMGYEAASQ